MSSDKKRQKALFRMGNYLGADERGILMENLKANMNTGKNRRFAAGNGMPMASSLVRNLSGKGGSTDRKEGGMRTESLSTNAGIWTEGLMEHKGPGIPMAGCGRNIIIVRGGGTVCAKLGARAAN